MTAPALDGVMWLIPDTLVDDGEKPHTPPKPQQLHQAAVDLVRLCDRMPLLCRLGLVTHTDERAMRAAVVDYYTALATWSVERGAA